MMPKNEKVNLLAKHRPKKVKLIQISMTLLNKIHLYTKVLLESLPARVEEAHLCHICRPIHKDSLVVKNNNNTNFSPVTAWLTKTGMPFLISQHI